PFGDIVELEAEDGVHLLPLRQDLVEAHVAHDRPQRGGRNVEAGPPKILDGQHRHDRVEHLEEDEEVDGDRGVVLGDGDLVRYFQELLPQVDYDDPIGDGVDQHQSRAAGPAGTTQPEHHHPLVLPYDLDAGSGERQQGHDDDG